MTPEEFYTRFKREFLLEVLRRESSVARAARSEDYRAVLHEFDKSSDQRIGPRRPGQDDKEWTANMTVFLARLAELFECIQDAEVLGRRKVDFGWYALDLKLKQTAPLVLIEHELQRYEDMRFVKKLVMPPGPPRPLAVVIAYSWDRGSRFEPYTPGRIVLLYEEAFKHFKVRQPLLLIVGETRGWSTHTASDHPWFGFRWANRAFRPLDKASLGALQE